MSILHLNNHQFGLSRTTERIIQLFQKELHEFYSLWLCSTPYKRVKIARELRQILRKELLGHSLLRAIADDILKEGTVQVDSALFKYLKRVYKGDIRLLLSDLQTVREENE